MPWNGEDVAMDVELFPEFHVTPVEVLETATHVVRVESCLDRGRAHSRVRCPVRV